MIWTLHQAANCIIFTDYILWLYLQIFYESNLYPVLLLMMLFTELRELIIQAHIFQVQYIRDCKKVYGRILNNNNVESSTQTKSTLQSEKIWKELYPEEPFELAFTRTSDIAMDVNLGAAEDITYDLVSAVKRQSSFYYQVLVQSLFQYICCIPMWYKIIVWLINSKFYNFKLYFISLYTERPTIIFEQHTTDVHLD